jgi:hypothetical protein
MNGSCHSKPRMHYHRTTPLAVGKILSEFILFHRKFQIYALLNVHPIHESDRTIQHGHTQTMLRCKTNYTETRVQSFPIREASRLITILSLPSPTVFLCIVRAAQLFNSYAS